MGKLDGKRVAVLAADMVERVELEEPVKAVSDEGADVEILSIHDGEIKAFDHFDPAKTIPVDKTIDAADVDDYDALIVPGGVGNPDQLRGDDGAVEFVRAFAESGKPMGVICHGPWVLVEAGVARGRTLTVADASHRHRQRGRKLGGRGVRRGRGHRHQPQARRHPGVQREDRRGVRRGAPRAAGGRHCGGGAQPVSALEPGLDQHELESEMALLESDLRTAPVDALPQLVDLVGRVLQERGYEPDDTTTPRDPEVVGEFRAARAVAEAVSRGEDDDLGDVGDAVQRLMRIYDLVLREQRAP